MSRLRIGGTFFVFCYDKYKDLKWTEIIHNLVVDEGLNNVLNVYLNADTQITTWYIGLKATNESPAAGWDAAGIGTDFTEFEDYDEATREVWTPNGASSTKSITNSSSYAEFTINASGTIYGAFMVSTNTKGGTTGVLFCCSNFSVARPVASSDVVKVIYQITIQDV